MNINIKRIGTHELPKPKHETRGAGGLDLRNAGEYRILHPGMQVLIPTGFAFEIPEGCCGRILPRSGLALRNGIMILGGLVDADYRAEVAVILYNAGKESLQIHPGDRIAQLVILPYVTAELFEVDELAPSERGSGAWGSTGSD